MAAIFINKPDYISSMQDKIILFYLCHKEKYNTSMCKSGFVPVKNFFFETGNNYFTNPFYGQLFFEPT